MSNDKFINEQYEKWLDENPVDQVEDVDFDHLKTIVNDELKYVASMSVQEYTLYKKWCEVHTKYPTVEVNPFFDDTPALKDAEKGVLLKEIKQKIWMPEDPEEYLDLEPEVVWTQEENNDSVTSKELPEVWNALGIFLSSLQYNNNIGRNIRFIVRDKKTKKYLGIICVSSDYLDLTARDNYIGWDRTLKTEKMINHTTVGSTIVPTQPLGYNLVGGKLLSLMTISDKIEKIWNEIYNDKLVGVTTTSIYGKSKEVPLSQYDRLKYWKKMGWSAGSISYECTLPTQALMRKWLQKNHTFKYFEWYHAKRENGQPWKRVHKLRSRDFAYQQLGVDKSIQKSVHQRGIYFCELFENTNAFLRGEITEDKLVRRFDNSVDSLSTLWKEKYAKKRLASLKKQDRISNESLFYDDLIYMSWEDTKKKYLSSIGR